MIEFELNNKLDLKKIHELIIGDANIPELSNKLTLTLNKISNKNPNLTYNDFFSYLCPKLNFSKIENICNDFMNKIKSELVLMQILNSDKEDDYFQNIVNGVFLKFISLKNLKNNEKISYRVNSMIENLNTLTEMKKYTNQMKKQINVLLKYPKKSPRNRKIDTNRDAKESNMNSQSEINENSSLKPYMEYTDSNRSNNVDGKFSLNCYENSYNSYDNNTIPNFNCNFAQNRKFEIKSLSNKKNYNSENFSFYNNNLNNIQFNNLNSSFSNKNDGIKNTQSSITTSTFVTNSKNDRVNLTNEVWVNNLLIQPKSRTLLSIASKMYKENLITSKQKGILKELILDDNKNLGMFLSLYEMNNNYKILYDNIIKLVSQISINYD